MKFLQARHFTKADRTRIEGITIHTAETPEHGSVAENLQSWTAGPNANPSSWHYAVDSDSVTQSVLEKDIAWHAGPVNGWTIGIELAGRAAQTAVEWSDDYSLAVLERAALLVSDIARRYNIPLVKLSADDLKAGKHGGVFGHVDVTNGLTGGKGHTDPGRHFPWQWFLERVQTLADTRFHEPLVVSPEIAAVGVESLDLTSFVDVECGGITWKVAPMYISPVGIGQANELAAQFGCELPSPQLVDAIWRAADLKVSPAKTLQKHDGNVTTMNSPDAYRRVAYGIEEGVGSKSLGTDFKLLAGPLKDVVTDGKRIGLYGLHVEDQASFAAELYARSGLSLPTHPTVTPGPGFVVQPPFYGHVPSWKDYSQGLRLVRRA